MLLREDPYVRVLIVEDELRMASLIRRGLVNEGLAADVAPTGEDALWLAQSHDYDAIVLDVMLPGIDGFEVSRRQHQHWRPHPRSPQPAADLEAVQVGQHHVEHDRVIVVRRRHPERVLAAAGDVGREALIDEPAADQACHPQLVLDDQHAHVRILPSEHEHQMTVR